MANNTGLIGIPRDDVAERCIHGHEGQMRRVPQISYRNGCYYDVWRCKECERVAMKAYRERKKNNAI